MRLLLLSSFLLLSAFPLIAQESEKIPLLGKDEQAENAGGAVIFSEDFESGQLDIWDADSTLNNPQKVKITSEPENVFHGKHAVEFTVPPGEGQGAKLNKWFMPGYDRVYARFYSKFAEDFDQGNLMHWVHFMGNRVDNKWSAFGKAGIKPGGEDFFSIGMEPWRDYKRNPAPGRIMFYTYHMDMPINERAGKYWGEMYLSDPAFLIERGRWYCMEMMVKANTPGESDGEQALWIDGKPIIYNKGIRFRTSRDVRLNNFWLSLYIHNNPKPNTCWFDELVISEQPIGPITGVEKNR